MSSKHTPGPWELRPDRDRTLYVHPVGKAHRIAKVCGSTSAGFPGPEGQRLAADARLLAAAPRLLAALQLLMDDPEVRAQLTHEQAAAAREALAAVDAP